MSVGRNTFESVPLVGASIGVGLEALENFIRLNLGNVILTSLPDDMDEAEKVLRLCREKKIYIMLSEFVHRHNHERWHSPLLDTKKLEKILPLAGEYFLGRYVIGESGGILYWPKFYTIDEGVHAYRSMPAAANDAEARKNYVDYLKKELAFERNEVCDCKLFNVESSIVFAAHSEAGIDGQCLELLPGDPLITLSAVRGAARAAGQNWGVHIAQMYYGGTHCDPMYLHRWRASLYLSYMAGAEFIYPECGHFQYSIVGQDYLGFNDGPVRRVRDELRKLYRHTLIHRRPAGFPDSPAAIIRGRDDGHPGLWNPYAWGIYEEGEKWESSDAERGWDLYDVFYRRDALFHPYNTGNRDCSGNPPGGQVDIIPPDSDLSPYKLLVFLGTNRMDEALYAKLKDFVSSGGHLIIALSHFDHSAERGQKEPELFREGRLHDLCGFDVAGTAAGDVYGISFIRQCSDIRYDLPVRKCNGDPLFNGRVTPVKIANVQPETRVLAGLRSSMGGENLFEEISASPLLVEHRLGKGIVLTITAAEPPGCAGLRDFFTCLIYAAQRAHRTAVDVIAGDQVRYAVYRNGENIRFYLYNSDPDVTHGALIFYQGKDYGEILLRAGAFRAGQVMDGLIFLPEDPLWESEKKAPDSYLFTTVKQEMTIINTTGNSRVVDLNGESFRIEPGSRIQVICPEFIPPEKAHIFAPEFLAEPEIRMRDLTTPY